MTSHNNTKVSIAEGCRKTGVSRQAYYKHMRRAENLKQIEQQIVDLVVEERKYHPRMGGRKLYHKLKDQFNEMAIPMGRDRLFDLLARRHLLVKPRRRRGPRCTDGAATWWKNILSQTDITGPNQGWVADISYLYTMDGFCYMALISDVYSRKIVGWDVSQSLELDGALRALKMAMKTLPAGATPIHHSDRGSQYRSKAYTQYLLDNGCSVSMTEVDHCAENAQAERVNGILKSEYYLDATFRNSEQATKAVETAIKAYNQWRPHYSLNYQVPEVVHQAS